MKKIDHAGLWFPVFCAYLGHILWGFTNLFTKIALNYATPNVLLAERFLLSTLFMLIWMLIKKKGFRLKKRGLGAVVLLGVMQVLYYLFESYGILYTNATVSGVVLAVVPIVAMVIAIFFLKEYPTRRQAFFCIFPAAGVVIMTLAGSAVGVVKPIGMLFLLLSCLSSAVYKNANRKAAEEYSVFDRSFLVIAVSGVFFTLTAVLESGKDSLRAFAEPFCHLPYLFAMLVLSLLASILANILVNFAVSRMQVVKLSSFGAVTTLVSMFSGVIFLKEPMNLWMLLGAILILWGVHQVTRPATAAKVNKEDNENV